MLCKFRRIKSTRRVGVNNDSYLGFTHFDEIS
jgi:hypothetical protein